MTQSSLFEIRELSLPGVLLITPKIFSDVRGYAEVAYNTEEFAALGIMTDFKQDFRSYSVKNVFELYPGGLKKAVSEFKEGAAVFFKKVKDPKRFGVPVFSKDGKKILGVMS